MARIGLAWLDAIGGGLSRLKIGLG